MTRTQYRELEAGIDIDATPAQVWALVSDVTRMATWSPQVVRSSVRGGVVEKGARFRNLNRQGPLFWPTSAEIVRFEPHRDLAFRVRENRSIWSFRLEEDPAGGTRLTQRRELPQGIAPISVGLTTVVLGGVDGFTARLERGMGETLARIKVEAEGA